MASTYSTNLALELIGNNDQAGTWGATTNTNLGTLIEQAISGYVTQGVSDNPASPTTLTIPNGATGVARNMYIEFTGALTGARDVIVPANKKLYFVFNNTTGGHAVTVKVLGQTGVSVPNGQKLILISNGTDIVEATSFISTTGGNLTINGTLTLSALTASTALALNASKQVVSVTNTGTGDNVLSNSPVLVTPNLGTPSALTLTNATNLPIVGGTTGTLSVARGGTGATDAGTARSNLSVPSTTGSGASGTWGINVTGSAGSVAYSNVTGRPDAAWKFMFSGTLPMGEGVTSRTFIFQMKNSGGGDSREFWSPDSFNVVTAVTDYYITAGSGYNSVTITKSTGYGNDINASRFYVTVSVSGYPFPNQINMSIYANTASSIGSLVYVGY